MSDTSWKTKIEAFDTRRDIIIPGDVTETVHFCIEQFLQIGNEAIHTKGFFAVALSGGQTPHAIFKELSQSTYRNALDWPKVLCFWSDERSAPPDHADNNYFGAMNAGLAKIPLLPENIFRMKAEEDIEENTKEYEKIIREKVPSLEMDLVMLGMGEDGHIASLFPRTHALHASDHLIAANYIPQKHTWRMTFTYDCINRAKTICIYVMGKSKAQTMTQVLLGSYDPDNLPAQRVGTSTHKALWILDREASSLLVRSINK